MAGNERADGLWSTLTGEEGYLEDDGVANSASGLVRRADRPELDRVEK